jgi:tetratricopeptide (TPR) repeat protein
LAGTHRLLGEVYLWHRQHAQAITKAKQAIALNPNDASGYLTIAEILDFAGRPKEALEMAEKAMRLDP